MLRSSLCDYNDAYILVKVTMSIAAQAGNSPNKAKKEVVLKIVLHLPLHKQNKQYTN